MKPKFLSLTKIIIIAYAVLVVVSIIVSLNLPEKEAISDTASAAQPETVTEAATEPANTHYIEGVPVIAQQTLSSGCETYACTMLLQYLGFKIDEVGFADNYLICSDIYYDDAGNRYGPDMYSAFAGTPYEGYGIYAPAMAKSMNSYLNSQKSSLTAYPLDGQSLESLCKEYIDHDIPVMVWGTVDMAEPYEKASWTVVYTDENAKSQKGDTVWWLQNEHCLVLIGYDEEYYYFADSCAGDVSQFERALTEERYERLGTQAIVVK